MKTLVLRAVGMRAAIIITWCFSSFLSGAQENSWTNPASGNWEDAHWSLGQLPGTNQDILFTNAGSKTLTIGSNTVQNFPETLSVDSVTVSSAANSSNILSLDHTGTQTPLIVQSLAVQSNSAMAIISSALLLNGPNSVGMQIGGEFDQTDASVIGRQINVGYTGPGIYNLNSGILAVSNLWVGGDFAGVFNQTGGTNSTGIVGLDPGGTYNFSGGDFEASVYFNSDSRLSVFHQISGSLNRPLTIHGGLYLFDGGINRGGIVAPIGDGSSFWSGYGQVIQTGGTNFGELDLGLYGTGNYVLSNGYSFLSNLDIGPEGLFHQFGGTQIITNELTSSGAWVNKDPTWAAGRYWMSGGTLSAAKMALASAYFQDGGANYISGEISVGAFSYGVELQLSDGLLTASNVTCGGSGIGQTGGLLIVTNQLAVYGAGSMPYFGPDLKIAGGELVVSNILLNGAFFGLSGGTLIQSGTLTLANGTLLLGADNDQFGTLTLTGTSSTISLSNATRVVRFRDSSSLVWSNTAPLTIQNWSGSLYGGGQQQIMFGTNSDALTLQQLTQIQFQNPAGLPTGTYPARILATGEIVPDSGTPPPLTIGTTAPTNGTCHLLLQGDIGRNYALEVSTDLVHWVDWSTQMNTSGTISIDDPAATNCLQRFYRARLIP